MVAKCAEKENCLLHGSQEAGTKQEACEGKNTLQRHSRLHPPTLQ